MEYIVMILFLFFICSMAIRFMKRAVSFVISIVIPGFLYFFLGIPFFTGVIICNVIRIMIIDLFKNLYDFSKKILLSNNRFVCGFIGKMVYIVLNINYYLFMLICYYNLIMKTLNAASISSYEKLVPLCLIILICRLVISVINKSIFS